MLSYAAYLPLRQLTAGSLSSLYALLMLLPTVVACWSFKADAMTAPAIAQAPPTDPPAPSRRPTAQEMVNEAAQRLRDRGELPALEPAPPGVAPLPAGPDLAVPAFPVTPEPSVNPAFNLRTPLTLYRLGPGDSISVFVQRFPDLSFSGTIDPEGNVVMPLLGVVPIAGLTLEEAQERIRFGLNRFVVDPVVLLSLVGVRPVQVTVAGAVLRPGFYPITGPIPRVSTALLLAGGTVDRADLRNVRVRRSLMNGTVVEQSLDLFTPLREGDMLPDLRLQDGDAVIVSRLEPGQTADYDRVLISQSTLSQQEINVRVLSYAGNGIGNLRLPNGSTFVDALTAISPNPDNANLNSIALIRYDPEQQRAVSREINGRSILAGDITQNVPLQDNDVIVVGRNLISRIGYALNIFTQPFRDVLGFLLFFDSLAGSASNLFGPGRR